MVIRGESKSSHGGGREGGVVSSSYLSSFAERFASYFGAVRDHPDVMRDEEAAAAEEVLRERPGAVPAHASFPPSPHPPPAGSWVVHLEAGGSVPAALRALPSFVALDSHPEALRTCAEAGEDVRAGSPFEVPLPSGSASRVLFLAVLHHYSAPDRRRIYAECLRVLRPGGVLVVGDVVRGSPQDAWLNGFVDAHNPQGHRGAFFVPDPAGEDAALLRACGFGAVQVSERCYPWRFSSAPQRLDFLRRLFHLTLADDAQIEAAVAGIFGPALNIPWRLAYFAAVRPAL